MSELGPEMHILTWVRSNSLVIFGVILYVALSKLTDLSFDMILFLVASAFIVGAAIIAFWIKGETFANSAWSFAPLVGFAAGALTQVAGFPIYVAALIWLAGLAASFVLWSR